MPVTTTRNLATFTFCNRWYLQWTPERQGRQGRAGSGRWRWPWQFRQHTFRSNFICRSVNWRSRVALSASLSYLCSSPRAVCSRSPAVPEPHSTPVSTRKQSRGSSCLVAFWRLTIQSRSRSRLLARSPRLPYPLSADSNRRLRPETKLGQGFRRGASGERDQMMG